MEKTKKLPLYLLLAAHTLFLTYSLLGHVPAFSSILKASTMVAIALLVINFALQNKTFTREEFFAYFGLLIISLIHSFFSENFGFFKLIMFAGSMKKVNFKKLVTYDMYLRFTLIVLVVVLCNMGIIPDDTHMHDGVLRRSMGFTNPNTLGIAVFVLVCDILYANNLKLSPKVLLSTGALSFWLYSVARCRTAAIVIIFTMTLTLIYNIFPRLFKTYVVRGILYSIPIIFSVLTITVVENYIKGEAFAREINKLLSGRILSIARFVSALKPTLFGQPINETIDKTLDNTYAFVWYDLGIIVSLIFIVAYFTMIRRNKEINIKLCIIMLGFCVYGLNEHLWINVDYNVFMLAFVANPLLEATDDSITPKKRKRIRFVFKSYT